MSNLFPHKAYFLSFLLICKCFIDQSSFLACILIWSLCKSTN